MVVALAPVALVAVAALAACGAGAGDGNEAGAGAGALARAGADVTSPPSPAPAVTPAGARRAPTASGGAPAVAPVPTTPPLQPARTAVAGSQGRPGYAIDLRVASEGLAAQGFAAAAADAHATFVATPVRDAVVVLDRPDGSVIGRLDPANEWGAPTVAPVLGDPAGAWIEVRLAVRPNGATGFVRRDDVSLSVTDWRVEVGIGARELVVRERGIERLRVPVAVGRPQTPTPVAEGWFRVFLHGDGAGYGRYVVALGVHSEAVQRFNGGDGEVAIHGTSAAGSIGAPTSNGCIRLDDDAITRLVDLGIPLGTPVALRP